MGKLIFWLIVIAIVAGYFYLRRTGKITRKIKGEKIAEQWTALIQGANGEGEWVIAETIRTIEKLEAPHIHVSRQERKPGPGFIKKRRQFLVAEHKLFDTHDMYISARDYGKQLFVSWYLVEEPLSFLRLFKRDPVGALVRWPFIMLVRMFSVAQGNSGKFYSLFNLFDTEELTAYVTTVHHAVLEAVKELMENRRIDFAKVDTKTRGFLNLS